jgi:hypothetical protein
MLRRPYLFIFDYFAWRQEPVHGRPMGDTMVRRIVGATTGLYIVERISR